MGIYLWPSTYMQDKREIPAIVIENCDKVLKFSHFGWGCSLLTALGTDIQADLHGLYNLSSSIDKVYFKCNSMSLGFVLLQEKLFNMDTM